MTQNNTWSILLRGHYGYGKTTFAEALAAMVGTYTMQIPGRNGVVIHPDAMVHIIDEIHVWSGNFEKIYPAMEQNRMIFCSNMAGKLPEPFISRCITFRMDDYTVDQLAEIAKLHAKAAIPDEVAFEVASRAKGNPRRVVELINKFIDVSRFDGHPLSLEVVMGFFAAMGIDRDGTTPIDRRYLKALETGPKSRRTMQAILSLDSVELDRVEEWLLREGRITITSRGRTIA